MDRVNCIARQRGYKARDKEQLIQSIIKLHDEGYSQVDIAKILHVNRGTIKRWNDELQFFMPRTPGEAGKLKNKVYHYDEDYFATIQTPNQAYLIGYIVGDGTLLDKGKSKRLVLALAEKDRQLLEDIAKELNMSDAVKFKKKNKENEQNKYSLVVNSTKMCNDLIPLGIIPRKTGLERWIDFNNDDLQWAFLRGFFDADGHIRVFTKNAYLHARLRFTSNREMLQSILEFLKRNGFAKKVKAITAKQGCFDLSIGSRKDIIAIYEKLYAHGDIKLNRKYEIFCSLMI